MNGHEHDTPGWLLLVDDEEPFTRVAVRELRAAGFACDRAAAAATAATAFRRRRYEVVIGDPRVCGGDALELLAAARRELPDIQLVIVAGRASLASALKAIELGVSDYKVKPVAPRALVESVARAARKGRALARLRSLRDEVAECLHLLRGVPPGGEGATARPRRAARAHAPAAYSLALLSHRERTIVEAIANGERVRSLARALHLSERTVRNHLQASFRKFDVHSQIELVARLRGTAGS